MNRKHLNLLLALVLIGLAAALIFGGDTEKPQPPLTPLSAASVDRIRLEHADAPAIELVKQDGEWRLTMPVSARADRYEINSLLALADTPVHKQFAAAGANLAALGLQPPKQTVVLNETSIAFGDVEPLQHQRYVRVGEQVALIDDLGSAAFDADPSDLIAKTLLPEDAKLERLELPGLTVVREGESWRTEPPDDAVTRERIEPLVEAWRRTRAMWNAEEQDAAPQGEPVRVVLASGEAIDLVIVARDPQLVISRPDYGIRYHLSKALADELLTLAPEPAQETTPAASTPGS